MSRIIDPLKLRDGVGLFDWNYVSVHPDSGRAMVEIRPRREAGAVVRVLDTTVSVWVSVAWKWQADSSDDFVEYDPAFDWALQIANCVAVNGMECWAPIWAPFAFLGTLQIKGFDDDPKGRSGRICIRRWAPWTP